MAGPLNPRQPLLYDILRAIKRQQAQISNGKNIVVRLHPDIAEFSLRRENHSWKNLEREITTASSLGQQELHHEKYEISEA